MTFEQFAALIRAVTGNAALRIYPGPDLPTEDAGSCLVLTRSGGPGFALEQIVDGQGWQIRYIGDQNDYNGAEVQALGIDWALNDAAPFFTWPDGTRLVSFYRAGSPPTPDRVDDAQRHHFVASYVATVVSSSTPTGGS